MAQGSRQSEPLEPAPRRPEPYAWRHRWGTSAARVPGRSPSCPMDADSRDTAYLFPTSGIYADSEARIHVPTRTSCRGPSWCNEDGCRGDSREPESRKTVAERSHRIEGQVFVLGRRPLGHDRHTQHAANGNEVQYLGVRVVSIALTKLDAIDLIDVQVVELRE